MPEPQAIIAAAHRAADAAAIETLTRFRAGGAVADKGGADGFDPVTQADRRAEAAIRGVIAEAFPNHGVRGEELAATGAESEWLWNVDPIDGTRAFISGVPVWTTLIAFGPRAGAPSFGLIDQPYLQERYWGGPDFCALSRIRGAQNPLRVRPCAGVDEAASATTDRIAHFEVGPERETANALLTATRFVRGGLDGYAYALLAAGHLDLVVEAGLKPVDWAALVPVIRAAGGTVTDWAGREPGSNGDPVGGRILAAGDVRVHAEALEILRGV